MAKSIISIGKLLREGAQMTGSENKLVLKMKNAKLTFVKSQIDGLYYTRLKRDNLSDEECNNVNDESEWRGTNNAKKG